ncbi:MAG: hypothetical protein WEA99_03265 [Brumimicrobium sp.]
MNQSFIDILNKNKGRIKNQTFDSPIELNLSKVKIDYPFSIKFENVIFSNKFRIFNEEEDKGEDIKVSLEFKNCNFKMNEFNLNLDSLIFERCDFNYDINLNHCNLDSLILKDTSSTTIHLYKSNIRYSNYIFEQRTIKNLSPLSCDFKFVIIENQNKDFPLDYEVNNTESLSLIGYFKELSFIDNRLKNIFIGKFKGIEFMPKPLKTSIEKLVINNLLTNTTINIENVNINEIQCINLDLKDGSLNISDTKVKEAKFISSNLHRVQFNLVEFSNYLTFEKSSLYGLKLSNVKWLKDYRLSPDFISLKVPCFQRWINREMSFNNNKFNELDFKQLKYQRESFRQLKLISFENQNRIDGLRFYGNEMRLYWKEMRLEGGQKWYDFILFFVNRWSSNFGQNWVMPIIGLIIISLPLYWWSIDFELSLNWNDFKKGTNQYLPLLNPAHKTPEFMEGGFEWLSFLFRIISGFFIYHFILASRKFGKRG